MRDPVLPDKAMAVALRAYLGYLLFVILFGAWVRITHSGAGCGSHWPLCDGEVLPLAPSQEKLIEFTHRITSGLSGLFGLALVAWGAFRIRGTRAFRALVASFLILLLEAGLGAGLVLGELVADDDSVARAVVIALHLANTLALTATTALAAWWAGGGEAPRWRDRDRTRWVLVGALGLVVATSMAGAVTALGDTLFPVSPATGGFLGHLREDVGAGAHFLVRLRAVHPLLALGASAFLLWGIAPLRSPPFGRRTRALAGGVMGLVGIEVLAGALNVALAAPGWLQLGHLLLAHLLWVALVLLGASALADPATARAGVPVDAPGGATPQLASRGG